MTEYENYVRSINKIFELVEKMRKSWNNQDNYNYLEQITEYKQKIIDTSKIIQSKHTSIKVEQEEASSK